MAIKQWTQTFNGHFPETMRRQLWPLCCGASILSGFKQVQTVTDEELLKDINSAIDDHIPDFQVYAGEQMKPKLIFLTLNSGQMASKKVMGAVEKAGFVKIGEGKPRGGAQGFFLKDTSGSFKTFPVEAGKAVG